MNSGNRILLACAIVAGLALAGCGGAGQAAPTADAVKPPGAAQDAEGAGQGEEQALADGWIEVKPEPNVTLQLRDGWNANRVESGKGPITFTGPDKARVVVWPMFVASDARAPSPEALLADFARKEGGDFAWGKPASLGDTGVRMFGAAGDTVAQASFIYARTKVGMVGYWYLTSAPRAKYAALRPVFSGLMKGVRISGAPVSGAASPALTYTTWVEPNEGAYSAEVPKGWRITGGVIRPSPLRLLDPVDMTSPDGQVYAFSGDRGLQLYKTPTQMELQLGMTEGSRNGEAILMRYTPAHDMIADYARGRLSASCGEIKPGKVQSEDKLAAEANRQLQGDIAPGQFVRVDVATVEFTCGDGRVGMVQLSTLITGAQPSYGMEGFGIWSVAGVAGFVSPRERAVEAGNAAIHLLASRKVNRQWQRGNAEMVAQINTISRQAADDMSRRIADRYAVISSTSTPGSGAPSDDLSRRWQNSTLDQTDVVDQSTGQSYKVDSGASYYWINQQGTAIVGTNDPSQPTVDFYAMTQLP